RADLVLLQEVDDGTRRSGYMDQVAVLRRLTGLRGAFGRSLWYDGGAYGIAILSRWPLRADTVWHLPVSPPQRRAGGSMEPRTALRVVVDAPGGPITVVNTHLDPARDDAGRRQEVRALLEHLAPVLRAGGRVLVGGDFNAEPGSAPLALFEAAGLTDAWRACGSGDGLSYPAAIPTKRIDYLLTSAALACRHAEVLQTDASDHRPVLVEVVPSR
ncbi:MAG TPA: endonuclease/exonuclease/phosphatase family protein, partial [Rhodothermales bacterium]|nr:endonuclease/exonuclease/phosphatase family protein [Rhodothermales bacterium]